MTDPLPPRPNAADVTDALSEISSVEVFPNERVLGHEVLHLRAQLSALVEGNRQLTVGFQAVNAELANRKKRVEEVTGAWMEVDRDELATDYPFLAEVLDNLAEEAGSW